jgi:hypothetical protein
MLRRDEAAQLPSALALDCIGSTALNVSRAAATDVELLTSYFKSEATNGSTSALQQRSSNRCDLTLRANLYDFSIAAAHISEVETMPTGHTSFVTDPAALVAAIEKVGASTCCCGAF